jgi:hypothetical protein
MNSAQWAQNLISAATGIIVGVMSILGPLKGGSRLAQASEYAAMVKRLTDIEARADAMGETIYRKDRQLIAAADEASDAKASAEHAERRAEAAELRAADVESRYRRLEHAFDELLKRTRMPVSERERLRLLYRDDKVLVPL